MKPQVELATWGMGNVELSRRLLREFNDEAGDLYGDYFAVYNIHGLLHLPEDVVHFGCSLNLINYIPFENYLQGVKKMVRNHLNPVIRCILIFIPGHFRARSVVR